MHKKMPFNVVHYPFELGQAFVEAVRCRHIYTGHFLKHGSSIKMPYLMSVIVMGDGRN